MTTNESQKTLLLDWCTGSHKGCECPDCFDKREKQEAGFRRNRRALCLMGDAVTVKR